MDIWGWAIGYHLIASFIVLLFNISLVFLVMFLVWGVKKIVRISKKKTSI